VARLASIRLREATPYDCVSFALRMIATGARELAAVA
jgi:hypothetical protein